MVKVFERFFSENEVVRSFIKRGETTAVYYFDNDKELIVIHSEKRTLVFEFDCGQMFYCETFICKSIEWIFDRFEIWPTTAKAFYLEKL